MRLRRVLAAAGAVALALAATTGVTGAASAASSGTYTVAYTDGDGVAVRSAPTASSKLSPQLVLPDGTALTILCQRESSDGSAVGPRSNRIFDQILLAPLATTTLFVPDAFVHGTAAANTFTDGIPRCTSSTATQTPFTPSPDLGVYCALKTPFNDGFAFTYRYYASGRDGDHPTCTYVQTSEGDKEAYLGAFSTLKTVPGDWAEACHLDYGPHSTYATAAGIPVCRDVDMAYNSKAQAQALAIVAKG